MTREELPETIISPITKNKLTLIEEDETNDAPLSLAQFFDTSTEWAGDVVCYSDGIECVYIPYEYEED